MANLGCLLLIIGAWFLFTWGLEAGRDYGRSQSLAKVAMAPEGKFRSGPYNLRITGDELIRALNEDDRGHDGLLMGYVAGVHDLTAAIVAQELAGGCCAAAAPPMERAFAQWEGDLDRVLANAPAEANVPLLLWRVANENIKKEGYLGIERQPESNVPSIVWAERPLRKSKKVDNNALKHLLHSGFTQKELREKFPHLATDPTLACLPESFWNVTP